MTPATLATPAPPASPHIASRWLVLAALGGTLGALVALFPGQALVSNAQREQGTDAVSLTYLKLLVQSSPDDARLRITLVRALAKLGQFDEARATLEPLLAPSGAGGREARLLALELSLRAAAALPADDALRAQLALRAGVDAARLAHDPGGPAQAGHLRPLAQAAGLEADLATLGSGRAASEAVADFPPTAPPALGAAAPARTRAPAVQRHPPTVAHAAPAAPADLPADPAGPSPDDDLRIAMYNASGQATQAIEVAMQAYARSGAPRWLLLAMDSAARAGDWPALQRLSALAHEQPRGIEETLMFWRLEAHLARHEDDVPRAREAYRRGLALRPGAMDLRMQAIWLEIDRGDAAHLQTLLEDGALQAQTEPAAWPAYASGSLKAGHPQAAWRWFSQCMTRDDVDLLWAASFLDALAQAGRAQDADAGRMQMLPRMARAWERSGDDADGAHATAVGKAYASVLETQGRQDAAAAVLQELVWRGEADVAVYERLVAASLARKDFAGAAAWVRQAQRDRQTVPGYQRLAVALHEDNRAGIQKVLDDPAATLSTADRVTGLRRLGQDAQALQLAQAALEDPADPSRELLRRQVEDMQQALARHAGAGLESRSLSGLRLQSAEVSGDAPVGPARISLRAAHVEVRAGGAAGFEALRSLDEDQAWIEARRSWAARTLTLGLGRNEREGSALTQGLLQVTQDVPGGARLQLTAAANESPYETSLLRAIGTKDRLSLYGAFPLAQDLQLGLEASLHRFRTRAGDGLAHGRRLVAELAKTLPDSRLQVRVSGSAEVNRLEAAVPGSVAMDISPVPASVESIAARRCSTLGAGIDWRSKSPDPAGARVPTVVLDAWAGRQWPADKAAWSARAALELPVAQHDVVAIEASESNVQREAQARASHAIALHYRHEF